jgi:hypothetical protein
MSLSSRVKHRLLYATLVSSIVLTACGSLGPKTLDKDQLDYGQSIGNNWKNQMLANIVKLRYLDMPVFVDVGSIVSGYTLETQVSGRLGFGDSFSSGDTQGLGGSGRYTDRPTITYMPKTGDDYLRSLLEPIEPKNLLALVQAGYNAELLFTWAVEAINGVHNYSVMAGQLKQADPEFIEFTRLLRELQIAGAVGFEIESNPDTREDVIFVMRKLGLPDSVLEKNKRAGEIIGLSGGRDRYRVIYAPFQTDAETLSIQTRSVLQTLVAMAGFVEVPEAQTSHATPGFDLSGSTVHPFRVYSDKEKPDQSFAAVKYQDYWYWIESSDLNSKAVFSLMLFLTTLTNRASGDRGPVLTIPTG